MATQTNGTTLEKKKTPTTAASKISKTTSRTRGNGQKKRAQKKWQKYPTRGVEPRTLSFQGIEGLRAANCATRGLTQTGTKLVIYPRLQGQESTGDHLCPSGGEVGEPNQRRATSTSPSPTWSCSDYCLPMQTPCPRPDTLVRRQNAGESDAGKPTRQTMTPATNAPYSTAQEYSTGPSTQRQAVPSAARMEQSTRLLFISCAGGRKG